MAFSPEVQKWLDEQNERNERLRLFAEDLQQVGPWFRRRVWEHGAEACRESGMSEDDTLLVIGPEPPVADPPKLKTKEKD